MARISIPYRIAAALIALGVAGTGRAALDRWLAVPQLTAGAIVEALLMVLAVAIFAYAAITGRGKISGLREALQALTRR